MEIIGQWGIVAAVLLSATAQGSSQLNSQDYDLYSGDFNGDGKTDLLYIAKSAANASGIDLSDGTGPRIPLQSWASNYLGISWSGNQFTVTVADFNGDGRADILLQSNTPGTSYLLFANAKGQFNSVAQAIPSVVANLGWSADQHHVVVGDFNHDGKADVFLQATSPAGTNAVYLADASGQFTDATLTQYWSDGYLGFRWATSEAFIYAADFNGDGMADLLIQARPKWVTIDYDVPFPVPTFPPNVDGMIQAVASTPIFQAAGLHAWNRMAFGADWSPLLFNVIVGDFTGDHRADVILQGKTSGRPSELLAGNASGAPFATEVPLAANGAWTADSYRLIAADFGGTGVAGVYLQSVSSNGTNYFATSITQSAAVITPQSPVVANEMIAYTYDALGRLSSVAHTGAINSGVLASYGYDNAGNRTNVTVTGASH